MLIPRILLSLLLLCAASAADATSLVRGGGSPAAPLLTFCADSFVGTANTKLDAHTATVGGQWQALVSSSTDYLQLDGAGNLQAVSAGTTYERYICPATPPSPDETIVVSIPPVVGSIQTNTVLCRVQDQGDMYDAGRENLGSGPVIFISKRTNDTTETILASTPDAGGNFQFSFTCKGSNPTSLEFRTLAGASIDLTYSDISAPFTAAGHVGLGAGSFSPNTATRTAFLGSFTAQAPQGGTGTCLSGPSPPTLASSNGFNCLTFNQDTTTGFDIQTDGMTGNHAFYGGMWQGCQPPLSNSPNNCYTVPSNFYSTDGSGNLVLTWDRSFTTTGCAAGGGLNNVCPLTTISTYNNHLTAGKAFGHGLYEARYKIGCAGTGCTTVGGWPAFWILGLQAGLNCFADTPGNYSEIDISEGFFFTSNTTNFTYHSGNTGAVCNQGSQQGPDAAGNINDGQFHVFDLLWTLGNIQMFLDGVSVGSFTTSGTSTESQLHMINLWMAEFCSFSGLPQSANSTSCLASGTSQITDTIQYVRHWSCSVSGELAC